MKKYYLIIALIIIGFNLVKGQQIKICIASDLHYFEPSLLINDGPAFQHYLLTERKLMKESDAIDRSLIKSFISENPDLILIPGDLTKDGEKASHLKLAKMLDSIQINSKTKVFVVPGNHDVRNGVASAYDKDKTIPLENISRQDFRKIYSKLGYGEAIFNDTASLSYVAEPIQGIWILGMDACQYDLNKPGDFPLTGGNFKLSTFNWIGDILEKAKVEHKSVIAFMHHGVLEHFISENKEYPEYLIKGYDTISNGWMEKGLKVVFTGHFHAQDIVRKNGEKNKFIYNVETGSTITYPCPYRIILLKDSVMDIKTKHITSINYSTNGLAFPEYARLSLKKVLTVTFKKKLTNPPYSFPEPKANELVPHAVNALIAHLSGDEKIESSENNFLEGLENSSDPNLVKLGYQLKYLWTDLIPADNNVKLNLKTGEITDSIY